MLNYVKFIVKRLAWSILVLFGLSILIFCLARIIPGNVVELALGPRATDEAKDRFINEYHLDEPIYVQYYYWLSDALQGDLGESTQTRRAVTQDIKEFLPATLELIFIAILFEIIFSYLFGTMSARYAGRWPDNVVKSVSYIGIATPAFVWAVLFMLVFCFYSSVFPTTGRISAALSAPVHITGLYLLDSLLTGNIPVFVDALRHLVLPAAALAMADIAQLSRITRTNMVENLGKDYVSAEISSGIPMRKIITTYVLRPSILPSISLLAMNMAAMIGTAFAVEQIFSFPGLSKYCLKAMLNCDLNAIVAVVMIIGIAFLLVNLAVDIISGIIDPRIRIQGGKE